MGKKRMYSSNLCGYIPTNGAAKILDVAPRFIEMGYDGFDFQFQNYPKDISFELPFSFFTELDRRLRAVGGCVSAVVGVDFNVADVDACVKWFRDAMYLCDLYRTRRINLVPRKYGVTKAQAWEGMDRIWEIAGKELFDNGFVVGIENHFSDPDGDKDFYFIHNGEDLMEVGRRYGGAIRLKFDPAWIIRCGQDPLEWLPKCLPYCDMVDCKDARLYPDGSSAFVTPGTGQVDHRAINEILNKANRRFDMGVEIEQHFFEEPKWTDIENIDRLHVEALQYYKPIFGE